MNYGGFVCNKFEGLLPVGGEQIHSPKATLIAKNSIFNAHSTREPGITLTGFEI